jgi:hypothetical protein
MITFRRSSAAVAGSFRIPEVVDDQQNDVAEIRDDCLARAVARGVGELFQQEVVRRRSSVPPGSSPAEAGCA